MLTARLAPAIAQTPLQDASTAMRTAIQNFANGTGSAGGVNTAINNYNGAVAAAVAPGAPMLPAGTTVFSGSHPPFTMQTTVPSGGAFFLAPGEFNAGTIGNLPPLPPSTFTFDDLSSSASGGAINFEHVPGSNTATITSSSFSGNTAVNGGAIESSNVNGAHITTTITNSSFTGNVATNLGGAITTQSTMTIANSSFSGNMATSGSPFGGGGGAILNSDAVTITNSSFSGNSAGPVGGAISSQPAGPGVRTVTIITNSSFTGNTATTSGGAIYNRGLAGFETTTTITDSSFENNRATSTNGRGGAIYGDAASTTTLSAVTKDVDVTGNAAGSQGGAIFLNGVPLNLNAIGGDIVFSGNMEGSTPNAIHMSGSGATANFNAAEGHAIEFLNNPIESDGGTVAITKTGAGTVSFVGEPSNISANTTVAGGTFEVRNGAVYGATPVSGSFTVDPGATLQGGVKGTVAAVNVTMQAGGMLNIAGNAPPPPPSAQQQPQGTAGGYSVFTIQANTAAFDPGSLIRFNTQLNSGNTQNTDLLVFNGATVSSDPAGIVVHNNGGTGGDTLLSPGGNGIKLIDAEEGGAVTAPNAFQLDGEARGGAFDYDLFRGSLLDSDPSMENDWFLRSDFVPQEDEEELEEEEAAGETPEEIIAEEEREGLIPHPIGPGSPGEIFPTHPLPIGDLPPGIYPIIGPELATYGVVQPIARQMGFSMLGTLHERIGDTLTSESEDPFASGWGRSGWVRFFGSQIDNRYEAYVEPSTTNGRMFGVQAGFDVWRGSLIPGQRDAAGLYFAYGNASTDVNGIVTNPAGTDFEFAKTGTLDLYGYSGGAYWTHYGPGGWYLDAVVQGTVYTGTAKTEFAALPTNGMGLVASLEAGYPIHIPVGFIPHFIVEPQGQILWQYTRFQSTSDGEGRVGLGATTGVTGRLGLRAQSSIVTPGGEVWQPYVRANLWRNTGGNATTSFGFDQVPLLEQSTQLEFAAGLTAKLNNRLSFYGQFGYLFSVGGDTDGGLRQGFTGDVGLRMTFGAPPPPPPGPIPVAAPAPAAARSYLVFFDWDKATLTARARQIIREAAESSTRVQYTRIEVNGHTDTTGTPSYNQGLSIRRAQAVAGELVRDGVPSGAITIRGYGQTNLLVPTGPGVREPQNRRVEIVLR